MVAVESFIQRRQVRRVTQVCIRENNLEQRRRAMTGEGRHFVLKRFYITDGVEQLAEADPAGGVLLSLRCKIWRRPQLPKSTKQSPACQSLAAPTEVRQSHLLGQRSAAMLS